MRRWRRRLLIALAVLVAVARVGYGALAVSTSRSQVARAVIWGDSDVQDYERFPARTITAGPARLAFRRPPGGGSLPVSTVSVLEGGRTVQRDLEQFLAGSDTTAFLILRGDTLLQRDRRFDPDHPAPPAHHALGAAL
jgi:hypothetical protein